MKKTVIFDLDGTLADIDVRRSKSLKINGKLDWDIFAAPSSILSWDKPNLPESRWLNFLKLMVLRLSSFQVGTIGVSLLLRNGLQITMFLSTFLFLGLISLRISLSRLLMVIQPHLI